MAGEWLVEVAGELSVKEPVWFYQPKSLPR